MDYSKIVSVTGLPGLYELLSSKPDGAIVRSLDDKTTRFASGRIHNFSHLESIEVYTTRDNVNLVEVFQAMEKASDKVPDTKDNAVVKKYFENVYPDIDFERVYNSDLKKMIKWFDVLKSNSVEIKLSEPEPEEETDTEAAEETTKDAETETTTKKPAAKSASPKKPVKKKAEEKEEKAPAAKEKKTAKKAPAKKGK